jgi:hypothetical protein
LIRRAGLCPDVFSVMLTTRRWPCVVFGATSRVVDLFSDSVRGPNGKRVSRAQGLPTNQNDDHAKYLSQKARVFGVGWTRTG